MPQRVQPKVYQLLLKTHKLTIFLVASPSSTIASLKADALSALQADVNEVEDVPKVSAENEFEICRGVRDKTHGVLQYEVLNDLETVSSVLVNWEVIFLQFRDSSGNLMPVEVTQPSLVDEEEEEPSSSTSKGKRKALPE